MLSVPDIAIIGAVALLVFGPEQLPKVARKFGTVMRDVQNTSQQFIREMERAADEGETPLPPLTPVDIEPFPHPAYEPTLPGLEAPGTLEVDPTVPPVNGAVPKKASEPTEF